MYKCNRPFAEVWNMQLGRELDALVAQTFFGWRWMKYPTPYNSRSLLTGLFPPEAPGRICVAPPCRSAVAVGYALPDP